MLISEVRNYIKKEESVSRSDLRIKFDLDDDQLDIPLNILIGKGNIEVIQPKPDTEQSTKCKGCPMGCKPKEQSECNPLPTFNIYRWIKS